MEMLKIKMLKIKMLKIKMLKIKMLKIKMLKIKMFAGPMRRSMEQHPGLSPTENAQYLRDKSFLLSGHSLVKTDAEYSHASKLGNPENIGNHRRTR